MGAGVCQSRPNRVIQPYPRFINRSISIYSNESSINSRDVNLPINTHDITEIFNGILLDINNDKLKLFEFRTRLSENQVELNKILQPTLLNHELILLLRKTLTTILTKWNSLEILDENEKLTFRNIAKFFSEISEYFNHHTSSIVYERFLADVSLIEIMKQCLEDMASNGKHLIDINDAYNLESFYYLLDIFRNYESQSNDLTDKIISILDLLTSVSNIIRSKYYFETFLQLPSDTTDFNILQRFLLNQCPVFLNAYKGKHSYEIHDTLCEQIFDQYIQILEHFLPNIETWKTPVINALTHIVDIMVNASLITQTYILQQPNIIDYGLTILRSEHLRATLRSKIMTPETWLINSILTGLHNMIYDFKLLAILKRKEVTSTFIQITSIATYDRIQIHAYLILAGILSEAEIQELNNAKEITTVFLKYLSKAMKSEEKMFKEIPMVAILCGLKTLVQHDDIKNAILSQDQNLQLLSNIIFKCHDHELAHALSILWTLSFNKNGASIIGNKPALMDRIRMKAKKNSANTTNKESIKINNMILSAAEGILWQVEKEITIIEQQTNAIVVTPQSESNDSYDVMISYSHDDKQFCHKIADNLVNDGFKVWIDKNNITGSTAAAIASGIENSKIVLLGMTYSYKTSPWCQREGNYAVQCQKTVIPLKLPPAYTPDGWLGLILAGLNYINFCKVEFNIAYEQLKTEIRKYRNDKIGSSIQSIHEINVTKSSLNENEYSYPPQSDGVYTTIPIVSWTNQNVIDFFNDKKLFPLILLCNEMDGPGLYEFYNFCRENSTVAFESLQKQLKKKLNDYDLSAIEYARFISEMKKLNLST